MKKIITKTEILFIKSLKLAKSNPSKTGLIILFDLLFLASIFGIRAIAGYFAQSILVPQTFSAAFILVALSSIYYLFLLFVYSFFKYFILDFIKSVFEKTDFSFNRLGQFYALNIIIAGIFFAIMILANFLLASVKAQYMPFVFIFMAVPYLLFLYVIMNTSHSFFYEGSSIKESIKKSFKITFTKMKVYRETILTMILFALLLWLLFFGSGYLIRVIGAKNYSLYLTSYAYFKQASIIVFDVALYLVILINRISFYALIREDK